MQEEHIEMLINSIETYDKRYKPPYFILFYLPASEEYSRYEETYFAVLAVMVKPDENLLVDILAETKKKVGNMIYAADYVVLKKDDAISKLESIID